MGVSTSEPKAVDARHASVPRRLLSYHRQLAFRQGRHPFPWGEVVQVRRNVSGCIGYTELQLYMFNNMEYVNCSSIL